MASMVGVRWIWVSFFEGVGAPALACQPAITPANLSAMKVGIDASRSQARENDLRDLMQRAVEQPTELADLP